MMKLQDTPILKDIQVVEVCIGCCMSLSDQENCKLMLNHLRCGSQPAGAHMIGFSSSVWTTTRVYTVAADGMNIIVSLNHRSSHNLLGEEFFLHHVCCRTSSSTTCLQAILTTSTLLRSWPPTKLTQLQSHWSNSERWP